MSEYLYVYLCPMNFLLVISISRVPDGTAHLQRFYLLLHPVVIRYISASALFSYYFDLLLFR